MENLLNVMLSDVLHVLDLTPPEGTRLEGDTVLDEKTWHELVQSLYFENVRLGSYSGHVLSANPDKRQKSPIQQSLHGQKLIISSLAVGYLQTSQF